MWPLVTISEGDLKMLHGIIYYILTGHYIQTEKKQISDILAYL